ncbi:protein transporter Sec31 [Kitasatospora sp. NPDC101235]|uniref:protein transporter Sec31 n=1 Tax=Kitasatospora sp. NPDC101235 TaxID=3364101 RepID=UPI0038116418
MAHQNGTFRRTKQVLQERIVPHTINGVTEMVTEKYATAVPIPPRDWDHIVRSAVTGATALTVAGSIAWSTASIGDLLSRTVDPYIGYTAAGVFDLAWISCMALEWLARYDRRKAKLPMVAGHVALVLAMAAVCTHGILQGGHGAIVIGIIGALVSALAKGMWTMTMRHFSVDLDDRSQQWIEARFSAAHARLATAAVHRELARVEGATANMHAAYELPIAEAELTDADRAAEYARSLMPGATDDELAAQLAAAGLVTPPTSTLLFDDHHGDHQDDHMMTTVAAGQTVRETVTSVVTPDPASMTRSQLIAAARRLDRQARKGRSARPVTIGTLQLQLGLSRREATEIRKIVVGAE